MVARLALWNRPHQSCARRRHHDSRCRRGIQPGLGGWIAQWSLAPTFLVLGAFGLAAAAAWVVLGAPVKQY